MTRTEIVSLAFFCIAASTSLGASTPTTLSRGGTPAVAIMHASGADEAVVETATEMGSILNRMSGGTFEVLAGGEPRGIILGTVAEFPNAPGADRLDTTDLLRQEEYIIRSDGERIWIVGASAAGACHAAWDFLHRLGFRQYFPGQDWEIIPLKPDLVADFDVHAKPDFHVRRFAWHYGNWRELEAETKRWEIRNRLSNRLDLPGTFSLYTGHAYSAIINANKAEIEAHPGITSIVDGRRTSKLNPANPRTLQMADNFAASYFEKEPWRSSISMDPSDGGGWGNSPEELAIGTPSDRAVFLANHVAAFINERFGQKYVGIYSYNEHSPAPQKVRVDPRVIVSIATSFIHGGYTVEDLMKDWRDAGTQMIGIREYHSVVAWDAARPTGGRAANLSYLTKTIPAFHAGGARFYTTEAGENWGPQGLGNYLTTRLLWDVGEAKQTEEILGEFVANCFPEAREPMLQFYRDLLHAPTGKHLSDDLVGRLYRTLDQARRLTKDPAAQRRLDHLALYASYAELLKRYQNTVSSNAPAAAQSDAAAELIRFAYRSRDSRMVGSLALFRDLPRRNKAIQPPAEADWKVAEGENPWKDSTPFTREEMDGFVADGIAGNALLDFEPVSFSTDLVPARNLPAAEQSLQLNPPKNFAYNLRHKFRIHTWSEKAGDPIEFTTNPGIVYQNRGDLKFTLYPASGPATGQAAGAEAGDESDDVPVDLIAVDQASFPPDKTEHDVKLVPNAAGSFFIQTEDSAGGFRITNWSPDRAFTLDSSAEAMFTTMGRPDFVFYVPRGTKTLGIFSQGTGTIYDGNNNPVHKLEGGARHVSIPIPAGMDGKFWRFSGMVGLRIQFLTVPPYVAPSAAQLLLPREVVEADGGGRHTDAVGADKP